VPLIAASVILLWWFGKPIISKLYRKIKD